MPDNKNYVVFVLEKQLHQALKELAKELGLSVSQILRGAVIFLLEKKGKMPEDVQTPMLVDIIFSEKK